MPFYCPQCGGRGSLEISQGIELAPDARSDEITLQVVDCKDCGFSALAVYEETRRGSFESDGWQHQGFIVAEADLAAVRETIQSCPDPHNGRCRCPAHRSLGELDNQGCWQGLEGVLQYSGPSGQFSLIL